MPFKKGKEKTGGRKKGVLNKDKREVVEKINLLWSSYSAQQLADDLMQLSPVQRLNIMMGLSAEFVTPKLSRAANDNKNYNNHSFTVNFIENGDNDSSTKADELSKGNS